MLIGAAALQEHVVSLTCSSSTECKVSWWLTRESGRPPPRCDSKYCMAQFPGREVYRPGAYAVLKRCYGFEEDTMCEVYLAELSAEAVDALELGMVPMIRDSKRNGLSYAPFYLDELMECARRGEWLCDTGGGQQKLVVCRFLECTRYYCDWREHAEAAGVGFFGGVTDAVGTVSDVGGQRVAWLRCLEKP